jgi:NAD+ kinase
MKYLIIRKLDDADSATVQLIVDRIHSIAAAVKWQEVTNESECDIIVVVGGDGTMLYGMNKSANTGSPVFGFNIGKIGYLAEFQPEKVEETIVKIVNEQFSIDYRTVLCEIGSDAIAINEYSISPVHSRDTLKYEFFIDGISSGKHHANALLISTPTGSTAYSLSVGGAILQPNSPVFQISPVAAMSLNSRSVVVSDSSRIGIKIHMRKGVKYNLVADGRVISEFDTESVGDVYKYLDFSRFKKQVALLHDRDWNFFEVLQSKLHWNTLV